MAGASGGTSAVVSIDSFGRIALPKFLRELLKTNKFLAVVEDSNVRLEPILSWDEALGCAKKINLKKFEKQHEEDLS